MIDVVIDALIDSGKVFLIAIIIYILLSFIEEKFSRLLTTKKNVSPIIGSALGLIPQCGISVVSADLFHKRHISVGTILAIFFACSDEALPILLSDNEKAVMIIPLIIIKFIGGFILGYAIDFIISKKEVRKDNIEDIHVGCCGHKIDNHNDKKFNKHFLHPVIHSLKIFGYVLVMNLLFGFMVYFIGEEKISSFLAQHYLLTPLFSCMVGLIPNCASSVLICELFLANNISFGALVGGLCANAGLGFLYLFKFKEERKHIIFLIATLFIYALIISYGVVIVAMLF